ncbi:MAG TPA: hypothetical protein VFP80_10975 [Thermoanaerobaculia bacterium]|nr:hypothetical protein [Thermoanaerobaculia bacterium]
MRRFVVLVCLCFAALSAFAQTAPAPPKMTWVRYYQVERGKSMEFMQLAREQFKPLLDALKKDGKIVDWGLAIPITQTEEPWTHLIFIAMPDWSGAEAIDQAIDKAEAAMTPELAKKQGSLSMSIGGMRDVILRHIVQSATEPKAQPKYIVGDVYKIKAGREGDAVQLFNEWGKPLFTDLAAKGSVDIWGLSTHGVPGAAEWTHMVWYFLHDLGDMEKVIQANESMEPRKMQGYAVRLRDMSEWNGPREQVWRLMTP